MCRGLVFGVYLAALFALGFACAPAGQQGSAPEPSPSPSAALPLGAEAMVEKAREDLGKNKGVPKESIQVVKVEAVEWSDASLGCPKPGYVYAQVITPGYRITLADGQRQYEYHTDRSRSVLLCER